MRTTSYSKDFPVVFAYLLELDTTQILKELEETKVITLMSQVSEFPQCILFTTGPRVSKGHLQWVPKFPPMCDIRDQTPAYRKQSSLAVTLPGFKISTSLTRQERSLFFTDETDHRHYVLIFNPHWTDVCDCDEVWP